MSKWNNACLEGIAKLAAEGMVEDKTPRRRKEENSYIRQRLLSAGLISEAESSCRLDGETIVIPSAVFVPIVFTLPIPPSVNNLFATGGKKRLKTETYREWIADGLFAMASQGIIKNSAPKPCRVIVTIRGGKGFSTARDLDNCLKPIGDLISNYGLVKKDNVTNIAGWKIDYLGRLGLDPATCTVEVRSISDG
jgi:hypothetical protein